MALSNEDVQRLNLISPATNDLKLGDIIQSLLAHPEVLPKFQTDLSQPKN